MLKVYVAAASSDPERARLAMRMVRETSVTELTLDWLELIENEATPDHELTREERATYARADLRAIDNADVVWLLYPEKPSVGSYFEFGYAYCAGIPVVVSGPCSKASIFGALGAVEHDLDSRAFTAICDFAREGELG